MSGIKYVLKLLYADRKATFTGPGLLTQGGLYVATMQTESDTPALHLYPAETDSLTKTALKISSKGSNLHHYLT